MRILRFEHNGTPDIGIALGDEIVPLSSLPGDPLPVSIRGVIEGGAAVLADIAHRLMAVPASARLPMADVRTLMPIPDPGKVVCLGLNYAKHAKEGGHEVPDYPSMFLRCTTSLIDPGAPMVVPRCSERLDYEAELMVVIGKRCRYVPESQALDVVFGYTLFNDGSVRDYQRRTAQWTAGKNFDGTGPVGPWIVTADELPPGADGLRIRSLVNGQVMQDANTNTMLFNVARTIAIVSEIMTLEPGDMIATGTPEGVGHARNPPVWLRPGDMVTVEVERIGSLTCPVVADVEAAVPEAV